MLCYVYVHFMNFPNTVLFRLIINILTSAHHLVQQFHADLITRAA